MQRPAKPYSARKKLVRWHRRQQFLPAATEGSNCFHRSPEPQKSAGPIAILIAYSRHNTVCDGTRTVCHHYPPPIEITGQICGLRSQCAGAKPSQYKCSKLFFPFHDRAPLLDSLCPLYIVRTFHFLNFFQMTGIKNAGHKAYCSVTSIKND